jgi:hypothetical protein
VVAEGRLNTCCDNVLVHESVLVRNDSRSLWATILLGVTFIIDWLSETPVMIMWPCLGVRTKRTILLLATGH